MEAILPASAWIWKPNTGISTPHRAPPPFSCALEATQGGTPLFYESGTPNCSISLEGDAMAQILYLQNLT